MKRVNNSNRNDGSKTENRKQKQTDKTTFESLKFSELIDFKLKLKTKIEPK